METDKQTETDRDRQRQTERHHVETERDRETERHHVEGHVLTRGGSRADTCVLVREQVGGEEELEGLEGKESETLSFLVGPDG
eukprot:1212599-Rhodomonas_salina.1